MRLGHLEEVSKAKILRSCEELAGHGVTKSGTYDIDPDGLSIGKLPIKAYCDFEKGETHILHDSLVKNSILPCRKIGDLTESRLPLLSTAPAMKQVALSTTLSTRLPRSKLKHSSSFLTLAHSRLNMVAFSLPWRTKKRILAGGRTNQVIIPDCSKTLIVYNIYIFCKSKHSTFSMDDMSASTFVLVEKMVAALALAQQKMCATAMHTDRLLPKMRESSRPRNSFQLPGSPTVRESGSSRRQTSSLVHSSAKVKVKFIRV